MPSKEELGQVLVESLERGNKAIQEVKEDNLPVETYIEIGMTEAFKYLIEKLVDKEDEKEDTV